MSYENIPYLIRGPSLSSRPLLGGSEASAKTDDDGEAGSWDCQRDFIGFRVVRLPLYGNSEGRGNLWGYLGVHPRGIADGDGYWGGGDRDRHVLYSDQIDEDACP